MHDMQGAPRHPTFGDYTLQVKLGGGGQGEVWRAQRPDGSLVALKLIPLSLAVEHANRLRQRVDHEVRALQAVSHPTIVKALETGERHERLYVAFELIDGQNANDALRAAMPPTADDCSTFLSGLAPGVDAVHRSGLIHRDIKPHNIVLRRSDWASPVLVDFGYVRVDGATTLTDTGVVVGTTSYIAPEVLKDPGSASTRSDQWSLGRVVLETLTVAFGHDLDTFDGNADMLDACALNAPSACQAIRKALATVPDDRYESIEELSEKFHDALIADGLIERKVPTHNRVDPRRHGESLRDYLVRLGCTIAIDLRPTGCLWFFGDHDLLAAAQKSLTPQVNIAFARNGGRATDRQPAWWTKDLG